MSALFAVLIDKLKGLLLPFAGIALGAALIWGAIGHMQARHWHKRFNNEAAVHKQDNDRWITAQARANAQATSAKLAAEARYAQIQKDKEHEITLARADADARLRRWMRDHAAQGGSGQANLRGTPDAATGPDADDSAAFLVGSADLHRCTEAFVTARGWQSWWASIQATQSTGGNK